MVDELHIPNETEQRNLLHCFTWGREEVEGERLWG
jgi:hypothetical protein